jgi:hypothetical protein
VEWMVEREEETSGMEPIRLMMVKSGAAGACCVSVAIVVVAVVDVGVGVGEVVGEEEGKAKG